MKYKTPADLSDDADNGVWDIGNIGAEPKRAEQIAFSAAYCEIEATYLVPAGSQLRTIADVDKAGVRIAYADKSAYGLWLDRNIVNAECIRVPMPQSAFDVFVSENCDALAGLRPGLINDIEKLPGSTMLDGQFTAVQQAMGTPRTRDAAGSEYLNAFVEYAKASGLVASLIERHNVVGLSVAGPA